MFPSSCLPYSLHHSHCLVLMHLKKRLWLLAERWNLLKLFRELFGQINSWSGPKTETKALPPPRPPASIGLRLGLCLFSASWIYGFSCPKARFAETLAIVRINGWASLKRKWEWCVAGMEELGRVQTHCLITDEAQSVRAVWWSMVWRDDHWPSSQHQLSKIPFSHSLLYTHTLSLSLHF